MRPLSIRPGGLSAERLLWVLAVLSLVFVAVLAVAPVRPYLSEWRSVQADYNRHAVGAGQPPIAVRVRQIWKPALGVADRCTSCHLGMGGVAEPIPGSPVFGAHPTIPHDPREFGCTVCHGGQGRATTKDAAHGVVSHWDDQMLGPEHLGAGCASCHDEVPAASTATLAEGRRLMEQFDCLACHRLDGRGRGAGPDLSTVAWSGYAADWYPSHLAKHDANESPEWRTSFGPVYATALATVGRFLSTRVGAPQLVEARALASERGCQGCHQLNGAGGDEGPALDAVGRKPAGELNFSRVRGARTYANYMRQHLLDPAGVFPGSTMVPQDYSDEEVSRLLTWISSLRTREVPTSFLPKDRIRRRVLHEGGAPRTAGENFGAFCTACHGQRGEGRSAAGAEARFPAIGTADFLNVASDAFITDTIVSGRPGRRMPALGASGGALDREAAADLVRWLRARLAPAPTLAELTAQPADADLGARVYRADCAVCHGDRGEGTALGTPLAPADRPLSADTVYAALVNGVPGTTMSAYGDRPAAALSSVLRVVLAMPRGSARRADWTAGAGSAENGADLYGRHCLGCHGPAGEGRTGPALANPGFKAAASPAFIAATIARGRAGTPMPSFGRDSAGFARLSATDILDLTAFIRERLGSTPRATGDR